MDWLDLLAVQGTLKSLLQYHSSKASLLRCSGFFMDTHVIPKAAAALCIFLGKIFNCPVVIFQYIFLKDDNTGLNRLTQMPRGLSLRKRWLELKCRHCNHNGRSRASITATLALIFLGYCASPGLPIFILLSVGEEKNLSYLSYLT